MESTLSTTASQISTIGITSQDNTLTVNGKTANAVNSISGTVSNGNLKIAVNGVESGDIPLPESELPTIKLEYDLTINEAEITSTDIQNDGIQSTQTTINQSKGTIRVSRCFITGDKALSKLLPDSSPATFTVSRLDTNSTLQGITNDFTITLPSSIRAPIENGKYKMPIDSMANSNGMGIHRKDGIENEPDDSEYIYFDIANSMATVKTLTITLPHEKFTCQGAYKPTRLFIITDRIIKIE